MLMPGTKSQGLPALGPVIALQKQRLGTARESQTLRSQKLKNFLSMLRHICRLENTLNYGMERVWTLGVQKGSNTVAMGFDEGVVAIKIGGC
jgi:hypothetical protein